MDELPNGWTYATIPELIPEGGIFTDGDWVESKDQDPNGDVRLIQLADIGDSKFIDKSNRFLTSSTAKGLNCTFLEKGDVLIARMSDPLGRACLFPFDKPKAFVTVVDVCAIRLCSDTVDRRFLMYLINSPETRNNIEEYKTGSTRKRISRGNLSKIGLPIPPLNEQKRIVGKIEELFSELDKGIESLKIAQAQLKIYHQAVLKHAFEGKVTAGWREDNKDKLESADELLDRITLERETHCQQKLKDWHIALKTWEQNGKEGKKPAKPRNFLVPDSISIDELKMLPQLPESWKWCKVGHLFNVYVGSTPSRKKQNFWHGSIPWVSSGEVAFCKINDTEEKITQEGYESASTQFHPVGTVMLAMIGEGKTRGQAAILNIEAAHNQNTAAIRVSETECSTLLFYYYLLYQYELTRRLGSGNNQKALNKDRVSNMTLPLMSLPEQIQIALEIENQLSVIENIEQAVDTELKKSFLRPARHTRPHR
jgi:type I restriction enzyme S subunit